MSEVVTKAKTTLVPALRFKEFNGEWNYKQLNEICSFYSGGTPTSSNKEFYNGDIPFIGSGNIFDSKVSNYITEEALNSSSAKIVEVGDLLYALYGANSGEVGISKMSGAINQAILCIRTESEKIDFIHCLLVLNKDKIVGKYLQGGQGNLSANIVKKLKYHFPSLPEQQKIASFLSAVDEKIQQLTKKKALLEDYKKGVMQQLFHSAGSGQASGQLRFKDENGNPYPDWEETFFADTGKILIGLTHTPEYQATGRPFLSSKNISGDTIDFENIQYITEEKFQSMPESTKPKRGDILFTRVGSNLGNPKVLEEDIEFGIFVSLGIFRVNDNVSNYFMRIWMDSNYFWRQLEQKVAGGAKNNLNTGWLKEFKLNLPSLPEQQKIASYLSRIDTKIGALNNQITQTQTFKKGLLQQMFV